MLSPVPSSLPAPALPSSPLAAAVDPLWEFWLDKPLRILVVLLGAVLLSAVVRLLIRRVTGGIARGTRSRIVRRLESGRPRWVEDAGLAGARQAQRAHTIGSVLSSVSTVVIWAVALLMVVSELDYDIGPVLASAGIAGVALSFGAQSLVKDYLSGIFMVAEDQLGIGDVVDLGEATGTVESVGLRVTQVRGVDGTLWHVRNGEILRVGNQSQGWARCVLDLPVPYDTDVELLSELIVHEAALLRDDPKVGEYVTEDPEVWGVEAVTGESLTVRVAVRTVPLKQWDVARALRLRLKKMLDREGLHIPLVNQTVLRQDGAGPAGPPETGQLRPVRRDGGVPGSGA
ncbi:mechanosensitive ion channel family protein [Kocuria sp. LUK]|uniref:Mechanosensitive ion channel protein MscS n=1 Tax=Kocuria flava TaxID=446860 RepID=A0A2N4T2A5_9MICC|nr:MULTISPECIES: mechanosensitive ion channel family protein [Kocuria]MCD1145841.1 mechanosensitive ion channel family protein [Kocuria sp. LUK]PLC12352.1 mechanosensitive ion channel protein MscS [Kocuria flava]